MFAIKITQFVNPHLFYYQLEQDELPPKPFHEEFKSLLPGKDYICNTPKIYEPKLHEIVAHYNITEDQWIRAQVDYITYSLTGEEKIYILFALDYGYSIQSIGKWLWPLDLSYHKPTSQSIFKGGINSIVPSDFKLNPVTAKHEHQMVKNWTSSSVMFLMRLIDSCQGLKFFPEMRKPNGHIFGSLCFKTMSLTEKDVGAVLVEKRHAMYTENFVEDLSKIYTTNFKRWHTNDRNVVEFGLRTTSEYIVGMGTYKVKGTEDDDFGSYVMDMESSYAKLNEARLKQDLERSRRRSSVKVANWQENNETFFLNTKAESEIQRKQVEVVKKACEEIPVVEIPKSETHVTPRKVPSMSIIEEEKAKAKRESKLSMDELLNALRDAPAPSVVSARSLAKPKPAGFILPNGLQTD